MNASFLSGEPMVIVPTHPMPPQGSGAYYFSPPMAALNGDALRGLPSYFDAAATSPLGANLRPSPLNAHYSALPPQHNATIPHQGNEMAIDELAPPSPSSTNSTDIDEYVLAFRTLITHKYTN